MIDGDQELAILETEGFLALGGSLVFFFFSRDLEVVPWATN